MKVALCISGQDRWSIVAFPFLYDSFKKIPSDIQLDVFYHSWNSDTRTAGLWSPKKTIIDSEEISYQQILKTIKIPIDYDKIEDDNVQRMYTGLLMFYGIQKIISEAVIDDYDFIIRIRPDIFLYEKIDLKKILNEIRDKKYDIWIPNKTYNYSAKGYNDQFAIGTKNSMKIYSEIYNSLPEYILKNSRWFPEEFLYMHLSKHNLKVYQENVYYQLIRGVHITTNHKNIPPYKLY